MTYAVDLLKQIQDDEDERLAHIMPDLANSEDPRIAAYRMQLALRKPSQRILLSQIFGAPEKGEDNPVSQLFRIRREKL